jgi:MFS family permease
VKWAPPGEKSRLIGFSFAGASIGSVISQILSGILCENGFYYGWGSIFIVFGCAGLAWLFALTFLTSSSPVHHPFISKKEKAYIMENVPEFKNNKRQVFIFLEKISNIVKK